MVLYLLSWHQTSLLLPVVIFLFGNAMPVLIRLVGNLLRWCGCCRLWTRSAFSYSRLLALICMFFLIVGQGVFSWQVLEDKLNLEDIPLLREFSKNTFGRDSTSNYDQLELGFCVFCTDCE
jgi:hypothetical protein